MKKNLIHTWFLQIRGPFLILSAVLVFIGVAAAYHDGYVNWIHAIMLMIGVVQAHIAVNLFNELSDDKTKIDLKTKQTPFSGGSGMLQKGRTTSNSVRNTAYINLLMAGAIGVYFCVISSVWIVFLMIIGGLAIRFYTSHFARWMVGEIIAGLSLGSCVVMGVYLALVGAWDWQLALLSFPPGILTTQLLFLNEFPDADADRAGGRHHWVIHWGRERSAVLYCLLMGVCFLIIGILPFVSRFPWMLMFGMGTLPLAIMSCRGAIKYHSDTENLIPVLGLNVLVILITDTLLGAGLMIA